ncbi:MAG: PD-(D/E)XK nuclease family protein, partial [Acidobacteriota bacterium]
EGRRLYEVPFSLQRAPALGPPDAVPVVLRGTIDCLLIRTDGSVVVIEFKTGAPRASHRPQLAVYEEAARALFPGARVEGRLIYGAPLSQPA